MCYLSLNMFIILGYLLVTESVCCLVTLAGFHITDMYDPDSHCPLLCTLRNTSQYRNFEPGILFLVVLMSELPWYICTAHKQFGLHSILNCGRWIWLCFNHLGSILTSASWSNNHWSALFRIYLGDVVIWQAPGGVSDGVRNMIYLLLSACSFLFLQKQWLVMWLMSSWSYYLLRHDDDDDGLWM